MPDLGPGPTPIDVARASCDLDLAGAPLPMTATEAKPGFDADLAALSGAVEKLPAALPLEHSSALEKAVIGYLLGVPADQLGPTLDRDGALRTPGSGGRVVLSAFATADPAGQKGADLLFLRRGLYRFYQCERAWPLSLSDFQRTIFDFSKQAATVIQSMPKRGPRRIYAPGRSALGVNVYVAQTVLGDPSSLDSPVRETEILLEGSRADGSLDFLVYGAEGRLVNTSEFAAGASGTRAASSPYTCMACHYDKVKNRFSTVTPG